MYILDELARKLGVNARTLRLYAQRKHFPSSKHGTRLVFEESVYIGLLAHLGEGKPLSTFRMVVPDVVKLTKPNIESNNLTIPNNNLTIEKNEPDNEDLSDYISELEDTLDEERRINRKLRDELTEIKEYYRALLLENRENVGVSWDYVNENYVVKDSYDRMERKYQKTIEKLEARISFLKRNPQPVDILGAVAPPLLQMAEKWLTHKNQTLADKIKENKGHEGYRGGFEPRENPDSTLEVKLPDWKNTKGSDWNS